MRLVACGGRKATTPQPAKDLYTGGLFKAARAWAEQSPDGAWGIISAKYGILMPDDVVAPYDFTTKNSAVIEEAVRISLPLPACDVLEVAAPLRYYTAIANLCPGARWVFGELPDKRFGYQTQWLINHTQKGVE